MDYADYDFPIIPDENEARALLAQSFKRRLLQDTRRVLVDARAQIEQGWTQRRTHVPEGAQ